jgi:N,N'-diacetyllegionaminate synthase
VILIAELATGHGGDLELAARMIREAAAAGATHVKTQAYRLERLNPHDPQADWLRQSVLSVDGHRRLMDEADDCGVTYCSTPFDADSLEDLRGLGLRTFKIASSESGRSWWRPEADEHWFVSYPWGLTDGETEGVALTAIPLYPTPLACVGRAELLDGWSDHGEGLSACYRALALGAGTLEVHLTIPGARCMAWDKTPAQVEAVRAFGEDVATMTGGVARQYRERWSA